MSNISTYSITYNEGGNVCFQTVRGRLVKDGMAEKRHLTIIKESGGSLIISLYSLRCIEEFIDD